MAFEKFYITSKGKRLLAKAQVGTAISFSKVEIGSGTLPAGDDILARTALVSTVKSLPIAGVSVNREHAQVTVNFSNQDISEPFYWREVGLYATDPDEGEILYAYGYEDSNVEYVPTFSVGPMEFIFSMVIQIGDSADITAVVDGSLVYCTIDKATQLAKAYADNAMRQAVRAAGKETEEMIEYTVEEVKEELKQHTQSEVATKALLKTGDTATGSIYACDGPAVETAQIRNIYAGTADLTAGTSALATGVIYFVYE